MVVATTILTQTEYKMRKAGTLFPASARTIAYYGKN
jgi:hypothetical protein